MKSVPGQKKRLSQVFLKDQNNLRRIVSAAELTPKDHVVEIGCGEGYLSLMLAPECGKLTILEIDPYFLAMTQVRLNDYSNTDYILGDALKSTFAPIQSNTFKVVANIPYHISAPLIKMMIDDRERVSLGILLVQKEFALKLIAKPNTSLYTSLSVYTRFYFDIELAFEVSRHCFRPVPKVDSAVLKLTPKSQLLILEEDRPLFFEMVRTSFWSRRKTFLNCLLNSPYVHFEKEGKDTPFFQKNARIRGEVLSLEDFAAVFLEIKPYLSLKDEKKKHKEKT